MKIMYFGTYDREYPRNKIFIEGLKQNKVEVIEVNAPIKNKKNYETKQFLKNNLALIGGYLIAYFKLLPKIVKAKNYEAIIVGFPSFFDVFLAKIISVLSGKKLYINPLVSVYNTLVEDRKVVKEKSLTAKIIFNTELLGLKLCDKIILDTETHIEYFTKKFGINKKKFCKVFVGADDSVFSPIKTKKNSGFTVGFYGTFIPVQGIEYIIEAARILQNEKDVYFQIVGEGQLYFEIKQLSERYGITNISFANSVPYNELPKTISDFDVCLGIFGKTEKASMVIPNKVYQCIAMQKPVITGISKASKEVFIHKKNIFFCGMADKKSLAEAILELKKNEKMREQIALQGYDVFRKKFTTKAIGADLKKLVEIYNS
jgi:glycosyltransferase involved in cell wall biosynthesis